MTNQFVPHKPEEMIAVTITKKEAVLVQKLRKYSFGQFVIHKANGILIRVEATNSELIDEDVEVDLS